MHLGAFGLKDRFSGDQDDVVSWRNCSQEGGDSGSEEALGPVAGDGISDRFSCGNPNSDLSGFVCKVYTNKKRVGKSFAKPPHPLEV